MELSTWSQVLPRLFGSISVAATTCESGEALAEALKATHQLRHAAVHRLPTSVKGIERMLQNSLDIATALQDQKRKIKLNHILMDFQATMRHMELHKNDLESQLDEELHDIQDQRKALDKREREAKLNMLQQDRENTATISSLFEKSIGSLATNDEYSANHAEHPDCGDADLEKSEPDAVLSDTTSDPNDEAAAAYPAIDALSQASQHRHSGSSLTDRSETAEQPIAKRNAIMPSELDPEDLVQAQSLDQSAVLKSSVDQSAVLKPSA